MGDRPGTWRGVVRDLPHLASADHADGSGSWPRSGELARTRYPDLVDLLRVLDQFTGSLGLDHSSATGRYAVTVRRPGPAGRAERPPVPARTRPCAGRRTRLVAGRTRGSRTAISSALAQAAAIRGANWDALDAMDPNRPGEAAITSSLHDAANAPEFTVRLADRLATLGREVVRALTNRPRPPAADTAARPQPEPEPELKPVPEPVPEPEPGPPPGPDRRAPLHHQARVSAARTPVRVVEDFLPRTPPTRRSPWW